MHTAVRFSDVGRTRKQFYKRLPGSKSFIITMITLLILSFLFIATLSSNDHCPKGYTFFENTKSCYRVSELYLSTHLIPYFRLRIGERTILVLCGYARRKVTPNWSQCTVKLKRHSSRISSIKTINWVTTMQRKFGWACTGTRLPTRGSQRTG